MKTWILAAALPLMVLTASAQQPHGHHQHPASKGEKQGTKQAPPAAKDTVALPQKDGHNHKHGAPAGEKKKTEPAAHQHDHDHGSTAHEAHEAASMSHAFSRNLPMNRTGSGTAWLPDNAPMYGYMFHAKDWMYMVHGSVFLRYNKQDLLDQGSRGGSKVDAPNMVMLMGQRNVGKRGLFRFSTMLSLDPVTVGGEGYPLLFQTGEAYKGKPLVDKQHPHDLISELSVAYTHMLSPKADVFLYVGYPGEPALGPSAYVHRPSGFFNPDAPLSHHWIDATHITFGVATLGFRYGNWKVEASSFTGREPGENRYNFDRPRFDSWSGRLSFNPSAKWAMQVSHGFLKEPEELHPGENVNRTTASVSYSSRGFGETFTNLTALWGMNKTKDHHGEHAALLEASRQVKRTVMYGRYEWVQKSGEELALSEDVFGHDALFGVHALTAGASYDVLQLGQTRLALGTQVSFYQPDKRLASLYGQNPLAGQVYLRLFPRAMGTREGRFYLPY